MKISEEKLLRWLTIYKKRLIFSIKSANKSTYPVFIQGCGRSGTTMLLNILFRDCRIEALGENDSKIATNFMLVKNKVPLAIKNSKAPVIAMKPILNSFEANNLLEEYNTARTIWMLRDYRDMVNSSIIKFGNTASNYLKYYIIGNAEENWISLGMQTETKSFLSTLNYHDFLDHDWMALIWWSVNRTVILDKLNLNNRFTIAKYENFVLDPDNTLRNLYEHIGLKYKNKLSKYVHMKSVGKGVAIKFNPIIEEMCEDLTNKLSKMIDN